MAGLTDSPDAPHAVHSPETAGSALPRTPLERAPDPDLGTELIAKERYTSPEWAALERERLWNRAWLLAGFEQDLSQPGDYFTFEIGSESILITRTRTGEIRASFNVCMHRGNRLVEPGHGRARAFSCGYHAWRYGLDGRLEEPLDEESFAQGCPREELSLRPVEVGTWAGFVFVNLDPEAAGAESLRDYLGVLPAHLDPYHFDEMTIVDDVTIEVGCNWKTGVDAFNEAYHIAGTHPDTLDINDDTDVPIDCYGKHTRMLLKLGVASSRHASHGQINDSIREHFLATAGIDPATFSGGADEVRPAMARSIRETQQEMLGADFSELHDEQLTDDFHYTMFPNVNLNIFGRSMWLFRHRPDPNDPLDPNKELFDFVSFVRAPKLGLPRAEHQHLVLGDDFEFEPTGGGGMLLGQDLYNLPRIQRGMNSRAFPGLHLSQQELRIRSFHATLGEYVRGDA